MSNEIMQKAIELIDKGEHVAVFMPSRPSVDCLSSAEVLARILEERGRRVSFVSSPKTFEMPNAEFFPKLSSASLPPKEFIISLATKENPVAQLRYEKKEDRVDVVFSPKSSPIKESSVSFREGRMLCDCAITLGVEDLENFTGTEEISPEFFTETPLVNIDCSPKNKNYGEVNMLDAEKSSLAEIIYEFSSSLKEDPLDAGAATLLLAGIVEQTNGFRKNSAGADTLLIASELLRLKADRELAFNFQKESRPLSLVQFLSRAAIRTKTSREENTLWSFLTKEDFEKTNRGPEDVYEAVKKLKADFPSKKAVILLWQKMEDDKIKAIVSGSFAFMENFQAREPGEMEEDFLKIVREFEDFKEAETSLSSLLEEIL